MRPAGAGVPEGTDWDLWLGPAPKRGYNSRPVPQGRPQPLPRLAELPGIRRRRPGRHGGAPLRHRPVGPGHGRLRPGEDRAAAEKGDTGLKFTYANGVVMFHGGPSRLHVRGQRRHDLRRSRQARRASRQTILEDAAGRQGRPGSTRRRTTAELDRVHQEPQGDDLPGGGGPPHRDGLPAGQHRLLAAAGAALGPGEGAVHRRQGGEQAGRSRRCAATGSCKEEPRTTTDDTT